jgi:VCBS repeat-containing protein
LLFNYTVPASTLASSPDLSVTGFNANGATLKDSAGNALNASGAVANPAGALVIDTVAPTISIATNDSLLGSADTATLTFTLSESSTDFTASDVVVTGGVLSNFAGSGANYTASFVASPNSTTAATVSIAAAAFHDAAGNNSNASSPFSINVDTVAPTLSSITTGGNAKITAGVGTINSGDTVSFVVNASEAITVTGTPTLTLNNGGAATYVSGSGTSALVFNYTVPSSVLASVADLGVSSMGVTGATLKDPAGNNLIISNATGYNPAGILTVASTNNQNPRPTSDTASATVAGDTGASLAQGNVLTNDTDPDVGDVISVVAASAGNVATASTSAFTTSTTLIGTYGTLLLGANGTYTYTPFANAAFGVNDPAVTDVFTYKISDGHGGVASSQLTVSVNGANNSPTISAALTDADGAVTENVSSSVLTDSGFIGINDVDLTDIHTATVQNLSGTLGGSLVLGPVTGETATNTTGSVGWTYSVANSAVQYLAAGQTALETFNVTVSDGHGGTVTQLVSVAVTGSNNAPDISVQAGDSAAASLTETNAGLTAAGTLTLTDADISDTVNVAKTAVAVSGSYAWANEISSDTLMGMLTLTGANANAATPGSTNNLGWGFNSGAQAFNFLAVGQTLTLTYTLTGTDSSVALVIKPTHRPCL